jgi:hypothetical protein
MKRLCNCVGMNVVLCFGWLSAAASACPVATGVALTVPVAQVQLAAPVVAVPIVVAPPVPVATAVAVPALSVVAAPVAVVASPVVIEKIPVRSSRPFRTPIRSLLFR